MQKCELVVFDRGQRCDVLPEREIDGSVLPSGYEEMSGLLVETSLPHVLWKRTFRRPGKLSFTLGALGLFTVTLVPCQQGQ